MPNITQSLFLSLCTGLMLIAPVMGEEGLPPGELIASFVGEYVSYGYSQRSDGYDFVTISIEPASEVSAYIRVRSRADRRRPTCSYDGMAWVGENGVLEAQSLESKFLLSLTDGFLTIEPSVEGNEVGLAYCCSGGATLADRYERVSGGLDQALIMQDDFRRSLTLQDVTFEVSSLNYAPDNSVIVRPHGLSAAESIYLERVNGLVNEAQVEDLNSDGSPELCIYTQSMDDQKIGSVVAFSTLAKKSMIPVYFPSLTDDPNASAGYRGQDEFTLIETSLARRFPVFSADLTDTKPIGTRQLIYKMVDGEAGRGSS